MTVCIASLFRWNYGTLALPDWGVAAITASDRMITAGDVQYEPQQLKVAIITENVSVLIAGDYTVHSEAIKRVMAHTQGSPQTKPHQIATVYGAEIQSVQRKNAEDMILAPLGLNTDTFLAQQKDMSDNFVADITSQLQDYEGSEVEAIVVGIENKNARLYTVDARGMVRCFDDVGFSAIGIGAWHARSRLMQSGYTNTWNLGPALAATFAAKKAAEVAPGVGSATDIRVVLRDASFPLWDHVDAELKKIYEEYELEREEIAQYAVTELDKVLYAPAPKTISPQPEKPKETGSGQDAATKGDSRTEGQGAPAGTKDPPDSTQ